MFPVQIKNHKKAFFGTAGVLLRGKVAVTVEFALKFLEDYLHMVTSPTAVVTGKYARSSQQSLYYKVLFWII